MLQVTKFADDHLEVEAYGKLEKADYDAVVPQVEEAVQDGKIRMLIKLDHFRGWTPRALMEELRFDVRHRSDFEKVAIVGDNRLQEVFTRMFSPLLRGRMRFFEEIGAARAWMAT